MANNVERSLELEQNVHRRVLGFLNAARRPEDLMMPPPNDVLLVDDRVMDADEILHHDEIRDSHGHPEPKAKRKTDAVLERELAKRVLRARDDYSPLYGFRHISQLEKTTRGESMPTPINVIHAALLHTADHKGKVVMWGGNDYSSDTVLWDPEDPVEATAFQLLSGAASGIGTNRLTCAGMLDAGRIPARVGTGALMGTGIGLPGFDSCKPSQ